MQKVPANKVSAYRQNISRLVEQLKRCYLKAGYGDLIFKGTPIEVFRTCGKKSCKCHSGKEHRHGPYQAIQTRLDGKQKQILLKQNESHFFDMARHYQFQTQNKKRITALQKEITENLTLMLKARTICSKE